MRATISLLGAVLILAGCTAAPPPAPTIDPGPVPLSIEDAGERYLSIVCQPNAAYEALDDEFRAGEPDYFAGGEPDVTAVNTTAAEAARIAVVAVEVIDDDYYTWPGDVGRQLEFIRDSYIDDRAPLQTIINAATFSEAYETPLPPRTPEQTAASREIRLQLGLDADPAASCVGFETALDPLHAEMLERDDELAG